MKRLFRLFLICMVIPCVCMVMPYKAFGLGTVTPVLKQKATATYELILTVTSDGDGAATYTFSEANTSLLQQAGMFAYEISVTPISGVSATFDITITNEDGLSVASSTECSSTVVTELDLTQYRVVTGRWALVGAGMGATKSCTIKIKYVK